MKTLYELKDKLHDELDEISRKPELGAGDLEIIHKLTDTVKNIDKICMLEEGEGYSHAGGRQGGGRGGRGGGRNNSRDGGPMYDGGDSYANRSRHWVRGHYSRDGGKMVLEHLQMAMDEADTEREREEIRRVMRMFED